MSGQTDDSPMWFANNNESNRTNNFQKHHSETKCNISLTQQLPSPTSNFYCTKSIASSALIDTKPNKKWLNQEYSYET